MPMIRLNPIQAWKLYRYISPKMKGRPHLTRLQRIYDALRCGPIEEAFEKNNEIISEYQSEGRPAPPSKLKRFRAEDPAYDIELDDGDFDKVWEWTRDMDKEQEYARTERCDKCGNVPEEQSFKIHLPLLLELDRAHTEYEAAKSAGTKSAGEMEKAS